MMGRGSFEVVELFVGVPGLEEAMKEDKYLRRRIVKHAEGAKA